MSTEQSDKVTESDMREMIFATIKDLRAGVMKAHEAVAVAQLVDRDLAYRASSRQDRYEELERTRLAQEERRLRLEERRVPLLLEHKP